MPLNKQKSPNQPKICAVINADLHSILPFPWTTLVLWRGRLAAWATDSIPFLFRPVTRSTLRSMARMTELRFGTKCNYLVWLFNGISTFVGYSMPKPFLLKDSNGIDQHSLFLSRGNELPWPENTTKTYARPTETLDSCFDLIKSHEQYYTVISTAGDRTSNHRLETLQLSQ